MQKIKVGSGGSANLECSVIILGGHVNLRLRCMIYSATDLNIYNGFVLFQRLSAREYSHLHAFRRNPLLSDGQSREMKGTTRVQPPAQLAGEHH